MRKAGFLVILATIVLALSSTSWSAELKIGYANLQMALNECQAGVAAKESLQKEAQEREGELQAKQEELKKFRDEIDNNSSVWNKSTLQEKEGEFRSRSQAFQQQFMTFGEELNKKKQESEARIITELRDVVEEIAKKGKYDYIFERSVGGILYAPKDADITAEVIKLYDKKFKSRGGK